MKSWRERCCVLSPDALTYYLPETVAPGGGSWACSGSPLGDAAEPLASPPVPAGASPKGVFRLTDVREVRRSVGDKAGFSLVWLPRAAPLLASLSALTSSPAAPPPKEVFFLAASERERDAWVRAIERALYSPSRRVATLQEATSLMRSGALCMREWELVRACIAGGTESCLAAALAVVRGSEATAGAGARASEVVESLLVDLALAHSEGALLGVLAGLRRTCAAEALSVGVQERLVELAVAKYGSGAGLAADGAAAGDGGGGGSGASPPGSSFGAAAPLSPSDCDGVEAAVQYLLRVDKGGGGGKARSGGSGGGGAFFIRAAGGGGVWRGCAGPSGGLAMVQTQAPPMPAEWTPSVQEAFALVLHAVAAGVQRVRVEKLRLRAAARSKRAAAAARGGAAAGASPASAHPKVSPAKTAPGRERSQVLRIDKLFAEAGVLEDLHLAQALAALGDEDAKVGEGVEKEEEEEAAAADDGWEGLDDEPTGAAPPPPPAPSLPRDGAGAAAAAAAAAAASIDLREETLFNEHYMLGEKIASGGYSTVFRGRHLPSGRDVAVKVVPKARMAESERKRLLEEVTIMGRLAHPHILQLHAFYDEPSAYFIVMELCLGGELFDRISDRKVYTEEQARDTARTLASAVTFLHSKSIAHRDLKPENIMLSSPDDATAAIKLGDLGFAKLCTKTGGLSTSCGTPSYVAPEILGGKTYGMACDMWSLGVIVYILLCGYPPFASSNQSDLFKRIMSGRYRFDEAQWGGVSAPAKDFITKLLVVDPARRATAEEAMAHPWLQGAARSEELSVARARMTLFNLARKRIVRQGNLVKQGGFVKSWRLRTFLLTPDELRYYDPRASLKPPPGAESPSSPLSTQSSGQAFLSSLGIGGDGGGNGGGGGGGGGAGFSALSPLPPEVSLGKEPKAKGSVRLCDVLSVEALSAGAADGAPPGSALLCVHTAGGRDLVMAAPDANSRSAWITAIIAVKTHGELVSKAWAALGGDCAAEVVQLMGLAHDWEDLIISDVQKDVVAPEPSLAFLGPRGRSSGALPAWAEGAGSGVPEAITPILGAQPGGDPSPPSSFALAQSVLPDASARANSNGGFGGGAAAGSPPLAGAANPLVARALESAGQDRLSTKARIAHVYGVEERISEKVRASLAAEAAIYARFAKRDALTYGNQ
jgi:serine/threonine protein kinase